MFETQTSYPNGGGMSMPSDPGMIPQWLMTLARLGAGPAGGLLPQVPAAHAATFAPRGLPPANPPPISSPSSPKDLTLTGMTGGPSAPPRSLPSSTQGLSLMDMLQGGGGNSNAGPPVEGTYLPPGTGPAVSPPADDAAMRQLMDQIPGLRSTRDANRQAYLDSAGRPVPQMGAQVGPHMNLPAGILMGVLSLLANREHPRLQMGTQAMQSLIHGLASNAQTANQNTQVSYQNQVAQHDQAVKQAAAKLGWSDEDLQNVLAQVTKAQDRATELQRAAIPAQYRYLGTQDTNNAKLQMNQLTNSTKGAIANGYQSNQQMKDLIDTLKTVNPQDRPAVLQQLRDNFPVFSGLSDKAIADAANMSPKEMEAAANAHWKNTLLPEQVKVLQSTYGLKNNQASLVAQITKDRPELDQSVIAQHYANANFLGGKLNDISFKQQLATDAQSQKAYSGAILGIRTQLQTLSTQMNTLRTERGSLEKDLSKMTPGNDDFKAQAQKISDIDGTIRNMTQVYNDLSAQSSNVQKRLAPVDANGNVQVPTTATPQTSPNAPTNLTGKIGGGSTAPVVPTAVIPTAPPANPKIGMTWQHPSGASYVYKSGAKGTGWYKTGK